MPRPPRTEFEDARYHVTSRGNDRQTLFFTDRDRERFLLQLEDNVLTYGIVLYAWVLMRNHFHLVLRTPRGNLSRFMQRLNSSYSLYFRYKRGKTGHVLDGRYKARLIEDDEYLSTVTLYVHRNPVQTRAQEQRSLSERMAHIEAYPWSSYHVYAGKKECPEWMSEGALTLYGANVKQARRSYRAYLRAGIRKDDEPLRMIMAASPYAIGSESFIEKAHEDLSKRRSGKAKDADLMLPKTSTALSEIDRVVCKGFGVHPDVLKRHGRRAGVAKTVAVELAPRHSGQPFRAIGEHYGGMTGQAVAMTRRRARALEDIDWEALAHSAATSSKIPK